MLTRQQQHIRERIAVENRVDSWWIWLRHLILRDFGKNFNGRCAMFLVKNHDGQWGIYGGDEISVEDERRAAEALVHHADVRETSQ